MTRSSQQTYIQRLGFQEKDRANPRHGLACEYLLERLIERDFGSEAQKLKESAVNHFLERKTETIADLEMQRKNWQWRLKHDANASQKLEDVLRAINHQESLMIEVQKLAKIISENEIKEIMYQAMPASEFISVPITSRKFVNGFADVFLHSSPCFYFDDNLKIQIVLNKNSVYSEKGILGEVKITPEPAENIIQQIAFYREFIHANEVIILVDYDAPQLKRMTKGSDIKVYRLGNKFDEWCAMKTQPIIEEF